MSLATDVIYRTDSKSKRYAIQQYKRSFLQSSNVHTKVTSLLWYILPWWWQKITNYGRFINQFSPNIIRSIWQFERIYKKICRQKMSITFNQICIDKEMLPNAANNLEQVLAATPHKTPTVRPPAFYHENYSS